MPHELHSGLLDPRVSLVQTFWTRITRTGTEKPDFWGFRATSGYRVFPFGDFAIRPTCTGYTTLATNNSLAFSTTFSTVKPNFSNRTFPGAEAPKRCMDRTAPSL